MKIAPSDCKQFVPRRGPFGFREQHQCPECGESMSVCDNCGGDYHESADDRSKCPSKRLNNTVELLPRSAVE